MTVKSLSITALVAGMLSLSSCGTSRTDLASVKLLPPVDNLVSDQAIDVPDVQTVNFYLAAISCAGDLIEPVFFAASAAPLSADDEAYIRHGVVASALHDRFVPSICGGGELKLAVIEYNKRSLQLSKASTVNIQHLVRPDGVAVTMFSQIYRLRSADDIQRSKTASLIEIRKTEAVREVDSLSLPSGKVMRVRIGDSVPLLKAQGI
jgi:hypothetical protein